jgi:ubiquinone/menaquinone biosynthesis C-methylase UbiE
MKRQVIPELLDSDFGTPAEIARSLSDLHRINRWFGGVATTQAVIQCVAEKLGQRSLSLLEVAAGAGYVPHETSSRLRKHGIDLQVTLLDRAISHLRGGDVNGTHAVAADALALPFADASFTMVSCNLFAHHLEPGQVVQFVNEALRVSRGAVLINDLIRHPLHLSLAYISLPLYRSRITHHDAPASVRRAYTLREMREMLQQTRAVTTEVRSYFFFRMGAIAWKVQPHGDLAPEGMA